VARTLGPTDRGYLALLFLLPGVLQQVGTAGLPLATTYFIASDPSQESWVRRIIWLPAVSQAVALTVVQAGVLFLLVRDEPKQVQQAALVSLVVLVGALADMYGKALLQGQRRYGAFNVLWNVTVTLALVAIVALVALGRADLVSIATAWALASLLGGALTVAVALWRKPARSRPESGVSRKTMFRFGLKGFLGSLSPVTTFRLDQAVIGLFLQPQALGLYVAGLAFTNLPGFISRGVATIALPQVARAGHENRGEMVWRFFFAATLLIGLVVVALELSAGWLVPFFFGADFEEAVPATRILLISAFFYGARRVLTDSVSGGGRPGLGSFAELASWIVFVPLLAALVPLWGIEGVASALAISSAVSLGVLVFLFRRTGVRVEARAESEPAEHEIERFG